MEFGIIPKYLPTQCRQAAKFYLSTNPDIIIEMYREEDYDKESLEVNRNVILWRILGNTEYNTIQLGTNKLNDVTFKESVPIREVNQVRG